MLRLLAGPLLTLLILSGCGSLSLHRDPASGAYHSPPADLGVTEQLLSQARQLLEIGELGAAEVQLERALRLSPRDPSVLLALAQLRWQEGDQNAARQLWQRGWVLSAQAPELKAAYLNWARRVSLRR